MIFGSLGVLNDVAISQAVTVEELRAVDPGLSRRELYARTMRIGVAHLAANVNTLVFAYLGAGLPLLVLLAVQVRNLGATANEEFVAAEVVRAVVGSIGVLAAVPLTTALATYLAGASTSGLALNRFGNHNDVAGPAPNGDQLVAELKTPVTK